MIIDRAFAERFAEEWIAAWNSHDLDRILSHYTDDFDFASPIIVQRMGVPSGRLKGKAAIREYWTNGLAWRPDLFFELKDVFVGVGSVVIHYAGLGRRAAAESFEFNDAGLVFRSAAHYVS
jgi:ketosteroid isomerase-like protein